MNSVFWLLSLSYVMVLAVLILLLLNARWSRGIKLLAVVLAIGFYTFHYQGLKDLLGWPAVDRPPEALEMQLLASAVHESKGDEAVIYVWLQSLDDPSAAPRAYRLPYSAQHHEQLLEAQRRQARGQVQWLRLSRSGSQPGNAPVGSLNIAAEFELQLRDKPRLRLPPK